METFTIIIYVIIAIAIILIIFSRFHNQIKTQMLKINSAENKIDESLRLKYDLLTKLISEVKQVDNDSKEFEEFEEIKDKNMSSFEFERVLTSIESKIYSIKAENIKLSKNKTFADLWYQVSSLNNKIKGEENYYNENTTIYNSLVSKFPSKIVASILHVREKSYFDGKDMYDKNTKDFKI